MILLPTTLAPIYLQDGGVWEKEGEREERGVTWREGGKGGGEEKKREGMEKGREGKEEGRGGGRGRREDRRGGREGGKKGVKAKIHTRCNPATTISRCGGQATQQSC